MVLGKLPSRWQVVNTLQFITSTSYKQAHKCGSWQWPQQSGQRGRLTIPGRNSCFRAHSPSAQGSLACAAEAGGTWTTSSVSRTYRSLSKPQLLQTKGRLGSCTLNLPNSETNQPSGKSPCDLGRGKALTPVLFKYTSALH